MRISTTFAALAWAWGLVQGQSPTDEAPNGTEIFRPEPHGGWEADMELTALFDSGSDWSSPQNLFARQQRVCPPGYPVRCDALRCCPGGSNCCSGRGCCPTSSNCRSDMPGQCCPKSAQTCGGKWCANAGSVCCTAHVCPSGTQCHGLGGKYCCLPSEISCAGGCCPSGSRCAKTFGYCERIRATPTTTRRTTTTSSTSSRTTSPATTTCAIDIERRQSVPTFTVAYTEREITIPQSNGRTPCLDNRELMDSMCKGMAKSRGCITNKMRLTYKRDKKNVNRNRGKMCPRTRGKKGTKSKKYCDAVDIDCDPSDPNKPCNPYSNFMTNPVNSYKHDEFHMTCDEFPFANTVQGGNPDKGTSICIPSWQNSYQGLELINLWRRVKDGGDYIIEVTGWDCKTGRPKAGQVKNCRSGGGGGFIPRKRDMMAGRPLSGGDLFTNLTSDGRNGLMMFLGDVPPGTYNYTLDIATGNFNEIQIIDDLGQTLGSVGNGLSASPKSQVVSFTVEEEAFGVALWAYTKDNDVSVSYNMTIPPDVDVEEDDSPAASVGYSGAFLGMLSLTTVWLLL